MSAEKPDLLAAMDSADVTVAALVGIRTKLLEAHFSEPAAEAIIVALVAQSAKEAGA